MQRGCYLIRYCDDFVCCSQNQHEENYADYPVVSLDDIRNEYDISSLGNQQEVVRIAKSRAKQYLRNNQSFVWNATSVTADIRSKLIKLFIPYRAYVRIVFLETGWEEKPAQKRRKNGQCTHTGYRENVNKAYPSRAL